MKSNGYMMSLMGMAAMMSDTPQPKINKGVQFSPDTESDKIRLQKNQLRLLKKKAGVKEFTIDGYVVYARDERMPLGN
jgi:hypothetical protein